MSEENELPRGWIETTLSSVAAINPGVDTSTIPVSTLVSFIPMAAVEAGTGRIDSSTRRRLEEVRRGYTAFREGDILFAKITPCMENGKSAVAKSLSSKIGFGSTEFHVLRPNEGIDPQLLYYFVAQESLRQAARTYMTGSAGQLRVPAAFLTDVSYPLAPTNEQHRIVAAIEQQFTRLDVGVAALQRAKTKLKRYRAAVLKAAVEGKLTEAWRAGHPTTEPASTLLERILKERRAKWEADLRAKGKNPANAKYVEPAAPDVEGLPELPEGWCWGTVEQVSERVVDCLHSTPNFKESGFICIDTNCIKPGRIIYEKVRYVDDATFIDRNIRMKPQEDDVIFSREGALLGVAVRVPANLEFCLGQRMMIFRLDWNVDAKYYENVLNSSVFRSQYLGEITGSASPHLNIQNIRTFAIPLPSLPEQQAIVTEVEHRMSIIDELEIIILTNLKRAERLRQSILREAFAGRLVPQDPDDEPASVLLERIRSERTGAQKNGSAANKNHKSHPLKVPQPEILNPAETEQVELWENIGG